MARLLASQWHEALATGPRATNQALNAAFAPALRLHLLNAYGWFLLASVRLARLPSVPPHCTADLPELGPGIVEPGEVEEYRQLEVSGWLAQLLAPISNGLPPHSTLNMLASSSSYPNLSDFEAWITAFDQLFGRMSDSLDEN